MSSAVAPHEPATVRPRAVPIQADPKSDMTLNPPVDKLVLDTSGRSTPVPEDAPPSAHSISTARKQVRARNRLFYTIDYVPRVSHFDPESDYHNFRGFFTLFWISLVIMVVTTVLRNIKDTGSPLRVRVWSLLSANVFELGLSDLAMVVSSGLVLPLHRLYRSGPRWLRWARGGMVVQSIGEALWMMFWTNWPFMRRWTWTAQVFFTLHLLTILMKLHSYAFYNGHLSETERRLASLDKPGPISPSSPAAVRYPEPYRRRPSMRPQHDEGDGTQIEPLIRLREDLATELTSPLGNISYPQNLHIGNYVDFLFCPTLCYELEYPRRKARRWSEIAWKAMAVFGCIFLLTLTSEEFIVPVLSEAHGQLEALDSFVDKALILAETISMLLFPFMVTFLLVFLVIFEYVLGAFAEYTRFADRHFYSDWWNSCDWMEFSREWNVPVHHFLFRHVYFPSRSHFSQPVAMFITFLVSSVFHELVMSCITKKLRGYGFIMMMLQLPIVAVQKSSFFRGRTTLNNTFFWFSMIFGLSMMCVFYVLV
ncbi:Sterol O-acyltransferase ACAT/DAG/ARE [Penicillium macrosclerotiorum]|uniref:Sterol O-acyltransferase ACAT/DAG/ARE n=1 Tax=Penicillium macrosclerotiorum TaxID=303699 RepID=UPI0025492E61|nr:Sterol O-acyltransferase ACAT/DAG/ARE [Penicillium macrosclerotiorum]KAJ5679006.1 Sterol O-acyltransferase ACAT/DAG/ARE [Penicillium macrosclerotiorum]